MAEPENWEDDEDNDPDNVSSMDMENGHVTQSSSDNEQHGSDSDNEPVESQHGQFDTDLPTTHRYLGKMNDVSGYTLFDDGDLLTLLGIYTNTLCFPGFTLPLVMRNHSENAIMRDFVQRHHIFVLLCADTTYSGVFQYGVTMEIFETQMRNDNITIKAKGRQRCKLVPEAGIRDLAGRLQRVTVRILAEPPIVSPIADTQFSALKSKRLLETSDLKELLKNYKFRRQHLAQFPLPGWVYDRYEVCFYMKLLLEGLSSYSEEYIPKDPVKLSYWFVQNYQLNHDERLNILKLNSTIERLRLEYKYLKMNRKICCDSCRTQITEPDKVFAMSKEGTQSNYVNPGGQVFETVTVTSVKNFYLYGEKSWQFSWFPGYAWTIMQCVVCSNHLGWQFTSPTLQPRCFYGLAKSGFRVVVEENEDDTV